MENLSERQKFILSLVIHEYTRTAQPVGSKNLVNQFQLEMSPATVRNELALLTEMNFLRQPHTSAGRIPTELGYRYFVGVLMRTQELSEATRRMIEHQFYQTQQEQGIDGWMKLSASILASLSHAVSLVSAPLPQRTKLKHLALVSIAGKQVLMVLVLIGGQMQQRFFNVEEQITQEQLIAISNAINFKYKGLTTEQIHGEISKDQNKSDMIDTILKNVLNAMYETDAMQAGEVFTDGLSNVLAEPEFAESEDARRALKILEEKPALQSFLSRTTLEQKIGGIQVLIGGEGTLENFRNCSLVLARYGMPGIVTGTIGVLGPMRMPYSRNIPTVRFVAGLLSDLVSDALAE
ncbi:heat-inducible transcriptional repressor HrcA [Flexilinea flocculi]|jgi:heat-inducible transcriptional repressor|uniref:Heat-inducible transcription repressor HrcA n=1 Tax=Flexilinea flocculi TaxID=1678840 RepID=A0A0K8PAL2_9CHLR|nr:heat-inducible transcriptional repressor HrcA [Flexilinea flocculi]NMB92993.1 heat-inducible transcription repressor HrcA [Flexilinea flocculi]GAP39180.1 heat-inducible transcription repressor HrcA [Flexilinea flocculi]